MSRPDPEVVVTIPDSPPQPGPERLHQVRVLRAPVRLWDRAAQHTAELMREFALLRIGRDSGTTRHEVPQALLLLLVADLRARYAGISSNQEAELQAAVDAGEHSRDFTYQVPLAAGDACRTLLLAPGHQQRRVQRRLKAPQDAASVPAAPAVCNG